MFRHHCFAERFRSQVCYVFFTPDSAHSQPLGSDLILHPQVCHIYMLQLPDSLPVENVLHWILLNPPRSLNNDTIPFDSDAPDSAAKSSAYALLLAKIFCFRVYAFKVRIPSITTPALDDFRFSLQPAESESVNTVSSPASFPYSNTCLHCLSRFKYLASL